MNLATTSRICFCLAIVGVHFTATSAQADPTKSWIVQSYKADRQAINRSENWREDQLRRQENSIRDQERQTWLNTRKNVPPQVRAQLDRDYHARRKAIDRSFSDHRDNVRAEYDNARDAVHDDFRQSLRAYSNDRRSSYYVPSYLPSYAPTSAQPWPETYAPTYSTPSYLPPPEEIYGAPPGGRDF